MKNIFDKTEINALKLKNRLFRSATWEALADESGHFDEEIYRIYDELSAGGVDCIISGFTSVSDDGRYFGVMARLSNDGLIAGHTRLTDSDIGTIHEMFIKAADRAVLAGYDGVQVHAAHGFFLSRYISPSHNRRADPKQLIIDIAKAIRANHTELHITMKINSSDFTFGGLDENGSMRICLACSPYLDSIEVSGNGTSVGGIKAGVNETYFKNFALDLAEKVDIPVILVGGHRSIENMNNVLNEGGIEYLSLPRPLIREPDLIDRWQRGECSPAKCVSCNMCYRTPAHKCIFRSRGIE